MTEKLLISLFNDENVVFPLSEIDKRITVRKEKQAKYSSVVRAIDG